MGHTEAASSTASSEARPESMSMTGRYEYPTPLQTCHFTCFLAVPITAVA